MAGDQRDIDGLKFADEVRDGKPGLVRAALLIARELAYPALQPSRYLARLDDWTAAAHERTAREYDVHSQTAVVARLLFEEMGLQGNTEAYYDPRNSFLNEVMDRRLGLPIALSALFLHVAQGVGLSAEGVGLPGHFIVAVRDGGARYFLDPFNRGRMLDLSQLPQLLEQQTGYDGPLTPVWLAPASTPAILTRMLMNLRATYLQSAQWSQVVTTIGLQAALQPGVPQLLRDLGLACAHAGRPRQGAEYLQQYLAAEPDADDAGQVRQLMDALYLRSARMN